MEIISNLAAGSDPFFTGRAEPMEGVRSALTTKGTCVIQGPSGIGKTRLAIEYAARNREKYSLIWFLRCDQPSTLNASLISMAERLGIANGSEGPTTSLRNDIRRHLGASEDWLLIFDNAPNTARVLDLLPRGRNGHLIVTAAQGNWAGFGPGIDLGPLPRAEAVEFLKKRAGRSDDEDAETLAKAMGDLPIALEQAGALIAQQHVSFRYYLRQFEQLWAELLESDHRSATHPGAVAMAWELAYRQLRAAEPAAADLLALCSYLSSDEIRLSLLHGGARFASYPLAPALADSLQLPRLAEMLTKYSLADFDERSIHLHTATASLARTRLPEDDQRTWARVAMRLAADAFKYRSDDATSRRDAGEVLPHLLAAATYTETLNLDPAAVSKAFYDAGQFFYDCGQYSRARDAFQKALDISQTLYGSTHPRIAAISDSLARALSRCGDIEQSRQNFERAIEIDSAAYGYNDPRVATSVNNYGRYHFARGDYKTAQAQFEWARTVIENHYGADHPRVAAVINNIGYTHGSSGDLAQARQLLEQAMEMAQRTYPDGHPDVARIAGNLGRVLYAQNDYRAAKPLLEKALVIDRAALGYDHPDTGRDHLFLGDLLAATKDFAGAETHYQQAMNAAEAAAGLYSQAVLACLDKLAALRTSIGDESGAQWARDRASAIRRQFQLNQTALAG
ncbi:MAG TPA: FxSxx-COOH system tetratricopeptide repeat protein [Tepidisphaeraceae bacterium]|jgi:tetratricopeptide (TPR) repeat protein|nr:FxSxx-COOH system tetratricopeptide repeat protein [Tepidisphaeraceae bacterium]